MFVFLSLAFTFIVLPACCVIEYYTTIKMGMYRFIVLYNTKITSSILTPDLMPVISWGLIIIMLAGLIWSFMKHSKILWQIYGLALLSACAYITINFYDKSIRAAPFFAVIIFLAGAFWVLGTFTQSRK